MCSYFVRSVLFSNLKITNIFNHSPLRPDGRHWPPASGAASRCRDDLQPRLFVAECGRSEVESGLINIAPTITLSGTNSDTAPCHKIFSFPDYTWGPVSKMWSEILTKSWIPMSQPPRMRAETVSAWPALAARCSAVCPSWNREIENTKKINFVW